MFERMTVDDSGDIKGCYTCSSYNCRYCKTRPDIEALKRLAQYEEIGLSPSDIVLALEKQIPKKPDDGTEEGLDWYCSSCGNYLSRKSEKSIIYCKYCGQKLDWEDN